VRDQLGLRHSLNNVTFRDDDIIIAAYEEAAAA